MRHRLILTAPFMALAAASSLSIAASPRVIATYPTDGARDVSTGANIVVRFDRPMDLTTIAATSILVNGQPLSSDPGANMAYPTEEGNEAIILISMRPNTLYQITLPTTITDSQGSALDQPYSWQFTTASHIDSVKQPMRAFARYPRMNEWNIPTNAPITVMFTSEIDQASITDGSLQVRSTSGGDPIPGKLSVQGARLVFRPGSPLKPNHPYEAVVAAGIRSKWAIASERPSAWQFNTGDGPGEGPIVTDAWYESYSDHDGRRMVLHAAVANLVKPGSGKKSLAYAADTLSPGCALKATVVSLKGLPPTTAPASLPIAPAMGLSEAAQGAGATNVVVAAYNHAGGVGQGNSVQGSSTDFDRGRVHAHIKNTLAREAASQLWDSGDAASHGDTAPGDGVYSGRLLLGDDLPSGPGLASFAIVLSDGQVTEPATVPFFILPTAQEQAKLDE